MSIPFDHPNSDPSGVAGYLKFLPRAAKDVWLGALFIMNARGEPVEFAHARVRCSRSVLWRSGDLEARCIQALCASMFKACPIVPDIVLCLAEEVESRLSDESLHTDIPVGRVSLNQGGDGVVMEWSAAPGPGSPAGRLFRCLSERGLLLEPFERAEAGLREVYSELLG